MPTAAAAAATARATRLSAELLQQAGLATLLMDLLTPAEEAQAPACPDLAKTDRYRRAP